MIPRRAGRNSGKIQKRIGLNKHMPARKSTYAFRRMQRYIDDMSIKKARGFFRCQVCLIKWQSGLAWAKLSETRRIIYKYGQVCRGCGDDGHTIYVRPYDLIFYDDHERLKDLEKTESPFKGPHMMQNCEMCNELGINCKYFQRQQRWQDANDAAAAYDNES